MSYREQEGDDDQPVVESDSKPDEEEMQPEPDAAEERTSPATAADWNGLEELQQTEEQGIDLSDSMNDALKTKLDILDETDAEYPFDQEDKEQRGIAETEEFPDPSTLAESLPTVTEMEDETKDDDPDLNDEEQRRLQEMIRFSSAAYK